MSDAMSDERLAELRADLLGFPAYELIDEVDRLRAALAEEQSCLAATYDNFESYAECEDRPEIMVWLDRAIQLRRQAVKTCERRTAERGVARARVDELERRELELLDDREEALKQLREMAALVNQCADLEHGKADPS